MNSTSSILARDFRFDLLRRDEQMGIILREAAHAGHAVQFAGLLVAIDGAELGQADGQIAIAARLRLVNVDVMRAVHRLEQKTFLLHQPFQEGVGPVLGIGRPVDTPAD